jgi:hypothetical protein
MITNTPCPPFHEIHEYPTFSRRESWENFLQFGPRANFMRRPSYENEITEMVYEKTPNSPQPMHLEDDSQGDPYFTPMSFSEKAEPEEETHTFLPIRIQNQNEEAVYENERSECCHSDMMEEVASVSTMDSMFYTSKESDTLSYTTEDQIFGDSNFDLEAELRPKVWNFLHSRPDEEKAYILKVFPLLLEALKELYTKNFMPLTDEIVSSILKDLLYGKELMIGAERQVFRDMVDQEMTDMRNSRPDQMVTDDDLMIQKRKEKKAYKGNRNTSNLNHLNENYVSNIFQFAKRNYPFDREVQKLGNERNVSALNFRNSMAAKLTDDLMARKAKARIRGNGRELVGNIEYWMKDGYFDQCADREKYIFHKEKALRDLALTSQY